MSRNFAVGIVFILSMMNIFAVSSEAITYSNPVVLSEQPVIIDKGETKTLRIPAIKNSGNLVKTERYGLLFRAVLDNSRHSGWSYILNILVNGKNVDLDNEYNQDRMLNKQQGAGREIVRLYSGPSPEYEKMRNWGQPWYLQKHCAWGVMYIKDFKLPPVATENESSEINNGNPFWYLIDIHDLLQVDGESELTLKNIGDKTLVRIKENFPVKIEALKVVKFESGTRKTVVINIPTPTQEAQAEITKRLNATEDLINQEIITNRLNNFKIAEKSINLCSRRKKIINYLPGHLYLNDYSSKKQNSEKFKDILDTAAANKVNVVKVHCDWADARTGGKGQYRFASAEAEKDWEHFIEMCHSRNMKVLAYTSGAYAQKTEDGFNPDWVSGGENLKYGAENWVHMCTGEANWRSYLLSNLNKLLETKVDGIYVDIGIFEYDENQCKNSNHIHAFSNSTDNFLSCADLLAEMYSTVKQHGKIMELFCQGAFQKSHRCIDDYCDYLIVGESTASMSEHREYFAWLKPYTLYIPMYKIVTYYSPRAMYASLIPYMQFPIFWWKTPEQNNWWLYFYRFYREMAKDNTLAYLNIKKSAFFNALPADITVSAYVNDRIYIVSSNYSQLPQTMKFNFELEDLETGVKSKDFSIPGNDFKILRLCK